MSLDKLAVSRVMLSRRWRGITVTVSISQRNATSIGVRPAGRGSAMANCATLDSLLSSERVNIEIIQRSDSLLIRKQISS